MGTYKIGKRKRFRRRGKRKEQQNKIDKLTKKQKQTWKKLTQTKQVDRFADFRSVVMPVIRQIMPSMIAQDLVGVQPMTTLENTTWEEVGEALEKTLKPDIQKTKIKKEEEECPAPATEIQQEIEDVEEASDGKKA